MGRSFTDLFIRRPVLASVVSLMILLVGLGAFSKLQIRQYPELESTSITITTTYPGANADLIKGFITTPLAQAVSSSEGIDTLVSNSQQNVSTITLNLRLNANADRAVADVLSKINQVKYQLPRESQDPVVVKKTGDSTALMYLSFNSKVLTPPQITDYLTRVVQPRLQTIDGVASADILGGQIFAMRVWLDPMKMAARGITAGDVSSALARNNFTSAAGQVKGDFTQTSIDAQTSLDSAKAFSQLIVANRGDALIRIGDIATTELGPESVDSSSVFDGEKAVFIGINATPTANPLEVITSVRKEFPSVQADLPTGMTAAIGYDATKFIRASISEVEKTLAEAALIVVAVIFLFLGNLRSTLIPIVTIPLSLVGVMIALLALGYSINLLTLLAMVLAIGLVVDDAIVVVENIYRHIEEGLTPYDASIQGAREITGPVISMTITLAAVYAPIGFVSGLTGALFREFAFALAGSVGRLGRHRAHAVADDVLEAAAAAATRRRVLLRARARPGFRLLPPRLFLDPRALAELPGADDPDPRRRSCADRHHVHHDAARAGAGGRSGCHLRAHQGTAIRQPRLHRALDGTALEILRRAARVRPPLRDQRLPGRHIRLRGHHPQELGGTGRAARRMCCRRSRRSSTRSPAPR